MQSTAQTALQTGKEYLASAQTAAQPHIENAKAYVAGSTQGSQPDKVPASTAPLESGPHVVSNPYPATSGAQTTKVGEL